MQRTRGRIATLALACLLLLSLSSSYALAQQQQPATSADGGAQKEEKAAKKAKKADKKQRHKYKGMISAVNGNEVTFKRADGENRKLTLNSEPRVKANGKEGSVSDLKAGMKATVRTVEKDSEGSEKVVKVRAHTPKTGKKGAS